MRQLCANCQEIGADIVQHELLCERPDFSFTTGKCAGQPNGLIRTSPYPSVCQYGLFYKDIHGNIDMSCITASEFLFSSSALARFPISTRNLRVKIIFTGTFENATSRSSKGDFIAAENLTDFGDLLEDLYIGKPIDLWMKKQVSDMLMVKLSAGEIDISTKKAVDEFIITDFNEDIFSSQDKIYQDDEASNLLNICRTLLLINVDGHAFQKL